jgi:hypothetical protein
MAISLPERPDRTTGIYIPRHIRRRICAFDEILHPHHVRIHLALRIGTEEDSRGMTDSTWSGTSSFLKAETAWGAHGCKENAISHE